MKILFTLTIFSLVCIAGAVQAGDSNLPLDKRVSIERLQLVEEYQTALQKCREHARKAAKNSCIQQRKDSFSQDLGESSTRPQDLLHQQGGTVPG